jgi:ferredoxin
LKLKLDGHLCTGHGLCYGLAPEVYDADDDGHSILLMDDVPEDLRAKAELGMRSCPERAISVADG